MGGVWLVVSLVFLGMTLADSSYSLLSPKGVNFEGPFSFLFHSCIFLLCVYVQLKFGML